ncbi:hypothetical protein ABL78_2823 [Leptomonas seymouri]|uniref:Uncharacterized protein n=1 Tax=Leptomonas seymouri TaxID=5684 RepID=A0A0N1PDZ6_LEPSE|nr:hypothetical protein ABL78_2823 [Leptomonas seymouri]|eukprot:KPI88093.1 hypothetical protein ABL78_2823 [Leptomonas seymouri]
MHSCSQTRSRKHRSSCCSKDAQHKSGYPRSHRANEDALHQHIQERLSTAGSSIVVPPPPISSIQYEEGYRRRSFTATLSSLPVVLPSLHASTDEGYISPRLRRNAHSTSAVNTVTIPGGLMPKEVPRPLRAVERRGKVPVTPPISQSDENLYRRWMNAYTYGTAASREHSFYSLSYTVEDVEQEGSEVASRLFTASESEGKSPTVQRRREMASFSILRTCEKSTQPEGSEGSDRDLVEGLMDRAGYVLVAGRRIDGNEDTSASVTIECVNGYDASEDEEEQAMMDGGEKATPLMRVLTPRMHIGGVAAPQWLPSVGRSAPVPEAPFLSGLSPVLTSEPSAKVLTSPSSPPTHDEMEALFPLDRVWTPSSALAESERDETPMYKRYSMLSHEEGGGATSAAAALMNVRGHRVGSAGSCVQRQQSLLPFKPASAPSVKSCLHTKTRLTRDLDASENDGICILSVSRLPGATDVSSSSCNSLWLPGDGTEREMGDEIVTSDEDDYKGDEHDARLVKSVVTRGPAQQPQQPVVRNAQELSLLLMSHSDMSTTTTPEAQRQQGSAGHRWTASPPRFHRNGHSAAVIGAQRVLTLLIVKGSTAQTLITKDGTRVTLPPTRPNTGAKTVTVDEAVPGQDDGVCLRSALLCEVAEEVRGGRCAALLLSVAADCGVVGCKTVESALSLLLAAMMRRQLKRQRRHEQHRNAPDGNALYVKMEVSIVLIQRGKYIKDLLASGEEKLGSLVPARPIMNPLLGSWCDNTVFQSVRRESQITSLLQPMQTWLSKPPEEAVKAEEVICVYVVLRQVDKVTEPEDRRRLKLSSLLIYVSRAQDGAVGILRNWEEATILQRSLLRRVGDGCFTVVASCVCDGTESSGVYASLCADACRVRSSGYASGDARRYMDTVREAAAREMATVRANPGDTLKRLRAQQRLTLRNDLLRRMMCLLSDPADCGIPFYPDRIAVREEAAERAARAESHHSPLVATSMSSDTLVQSILSSASCIHIPGTLEALEIFGDGQVHTVALRSASRVCGYELIGGTDSGLVRVADGAIFCVDELRPRRILPPLPPLPPQSIATHTSALCTLFTNGYNVALAAFDGCASNVLSSPAWYVLAEAIDRALNRVDVRRRDVRMAISVVRSSGETLDLMNPAATVVPLQVSSSPLFGSVVHTSKLHPVTSQGTLCELLITLVPKVADLWTPNAFLYVSLVNYFHTDDDAFASSLNLSMFGSHATLCQSILSNGRDTSGGDGMPLHPNVLRLHYGILSGSAASVFLISLANPGDADSAMEIVQTEVPRLSKTAYHSSSVKEFIRRTSTGLERRWIRAELASAAERAYLSRVRHNITDMLDDSATLLAPSSDMFPKTYLSEQVAASPPSSAHTCAHASDGGEGRGKTRVVPSSSSSTLAATAARSANRNGTHTSDERPPKERGAEYSTTVSRQNLCSDKESAAEDLSVTAVSTTAGVSHPQWVVGVELGGRAAVEVQVIGKGLEWAPTRERFDTDGILFYRAAESDAKYLFTRDCEATQRLRENACAAHSCAILGLVDGCGTAPNLHVRTQPLWRSFTALVLNSAFRSGGGDTGAAATWKDGSELHIRMCAVQDRTLLFDFLLDGTDAEGETSELPVKVALAANPLFGPVVRNTTVMRAGNAQECQCIFRSGLEALNNLAGEYPSGTVVIASVVLKNVTDDDILFSSITAFGVRVGRDLPALRDILTMDPKGAAPPSLYQYSLRGPCHLLCLTTLGSSSKVHCVEALRLSQGIRHGTAPPVLAGSLRACLREQQDVLKRGGTSGQARANTEHVVQHLVKMMSDAFAPIVIFPFRDDGAPSLLSLQGINGSIRTTQSSLNGCPATSPGSLGTGGACCHVTAVVTAAGRSAVPTLCARPETNTVHAARTSYPFSEVVLRANNSSVLRPGLISSIVHRTLQGRNTALVIADGVGSNTGASLLSKLVSVFIRSTGDNGHGVNTTLFMSILAVRFPVSAAADGGAMMKDLFSAESSFYPLQVAYSPFFGVCVDGAHFSSLKRIGDVYLTLTDAQKACCYLKATLVVSIVLKQVVRDADGNVQDFLMSSLFSVINTAESNNGTYACSVYDNMLNLREEALMSHLPDDPRTTAWRGCLLARVFGGESFTYGVVGLTADANEEEAAAMMRFGSRLMQLSCHVPAKSSAVGLLQQATRKLREGSVSSADVGSAPVSGVLWDWHDVKAEAESMLRSPDTYKPRAFLGD